MEIEIWPAVFWSTFLLTDRLWPNKLSYVMACQQFVSVIDWKLRALMFLYTQKTALQHKYFRVLKYEALLKYWCKFWHFGTILCSVFTICCCLLRQGSWLLVLARFPSIVCPSKMCTTKNINPEAKMHFSSTNWLFIYWCSARHFVVLLTFSFRRLIEYTFYSARLYSMCLIEEV